MIGRISPRRPFHPQEVFAHEDPFRLRTRGPSSAKKCLRTRRPISSANARRVQREKVSSHTKTHFVCERAARPARKSVFAHEDPFRLRTRGASIAKKCLRTRRPISSANASPSGVPCEEVSSHTKTHFVCERAARPARKSIFAHEDPFRLRTRASPASNKALEPG